jgi:undecaprenyldiphospho-muramoylpentapeptide beta-N-acetylglucosaminyltransferase
VIAGGGTAGHVLPAIAVGRALVRRGHLPASIHFVGSRRGIEGGLVADAGFPITVLPGRGVARRLTLANLAAVGGLVVAIGRATVLVARERPSVVLAVGGYASLPCVAAAALWRVPIVVAEQNAVPGAANRVAAVLARASAVSFPGTRLRRSVLTGNPVRPEVLAVDRSAEGRRAARVALGLPTEASVVAAFGGSLGALTINRTVSGLARAWRDRPGTAIRHVIGRRDWDEVRVAGDGASPGRLVYQQVRYEDRMDLVYGAADLAVCRAGATTVAELATVGLPAVLVPLPGAPGDHQTANARALEEAGAARLVPDASLTVDRLAAELDTLLGDPALLSRMGRAGRASAHPGAADAVAAMAEEHARG